jgi:hypothetical protein
VVEAEGEKHVGFVYWQRGKFFLGFLIAYPQHWTQGLSLQELKENLKDLHFELTRGGL